MDHRTWKTTFGVRLFGNFQKPCESLEWKEALGVEEFLPLGVGRRETNPDCRFLDKLAGLNRPFYCLMGTRRRKWKWSLMLINTIDQDSCSGFCHFNDANSYHTPITSSAHKTLIFTPPSLGESKHPADGRVGPCPGKMLFQQYHIVGGGCLTARRSRLWSSLRGVRGVCVSSHHLCDTVMLRGTLTNIHIKIWLPE